MDIKVGVLLQGVAEFKRAVELTDARTRSRTIAVIERGTKAVAARARGKAPKRTGELASSIRDEYSKDRMTGFVKAGFGKLLRRSRASTAEGKAKASAKRANNRLQLALAGNSRQAQSVVDIGVYAPVVERGDKRRHKSPHPFVIPALMEERSTIMAELKDAPIQAANDARLT